MNTELLSQHLHNVLLTLILATLLFKGSPSLVKPSQAQAEGSLVFASYNKNKKSISMMEMWRFITVAAAAEAGTV